MPEKEHLTIWLASLATATAGNARSQARFLIKLCGYFLKTIVLLCTVRHQL